MGKIALSSSSSLPAEQGRRAWAPAVALAGGLGHGAAGTRGERERGPRGIDSPLIREEAARGGVATAVGGGRRSAFVVAALWGAAATGDRGEMERRVRGFHPRAHLGLGWLEGAARLRWADSGLWCRGGGAAS